MEFVDRCPREKIPNRNDCVTLHEKCTQKCKFKRYCRKIEFAEPHCYGMYSDTKKLGLRKAASKRKAHQKVKESLKDVLLRMMWKFLFIVDDAMTKLINFLVFLICYKGVKINDNKNDLNLSYFILDFSLFTYFLKTLSNMTFKYDLEFCYETAIWMSALYYSKLLFELLT